MSVKLMLPMIVIELAYSSKGLSLYWILLFGRSDIGVHLLMTAGF